MLQSLHQLHGPLLYTLQYDHVSLVLENSEWTQWSMCGLNSAELRGRNISLNLLAAPIQIPRISLCYFLVFFSFSKFNFWFTFSSLTTRTTQICYSVDLLSSLMALSMSWCLRLFFHRFRTLYFSLLNFMMLQPVQLSSLAMSLLWVAAWLSGASTTPFSFVPSENLLRVHSVPSSKS